MAGFYLGKNGSDIAAVIHKLGFFGAIFVLLALIAILTFAFVYRIISRSHSDAAGKSEDR
jgi:hypothetical protein